MVKQFGFYKELKENLTEHDALIHIDFSENYFCKWDSEIQSAHYGASKKQLSLHTGFYQIGTGDVHSFCGISDSLQHDPIAIWAYLFPMLEKIRVDFPRVKTLHFFSDGPTAQYRQKINFFLFSNIVCDMGFSNCIWNFFEAGHGKGIPDSIGATIKRAADRAVKYGTNICSAEDFVRIGSKSTPSVHLYEINEDKMDEIKNTFPFEGLKKFQQ